MKLRIETSALVLLSLICPLLLQSGCKEKTDATMDAPSMSNHDTNAAMADADNTRKNVRDRDDATLTPGDQGNSDADREITRSIRRSLMSETNSFSMTAKNVKIITVNGKVTLRGPVNTDAEKMGIAANAKSVAGEGNVDDQLEVKANP